MEEMEGRVCELRERSQVQAKRVDELSSLFRQKREELRIFDELMERDSNLRNRLVRLETELKSTQSAVAEAEAAMDSLTNDEREYSRLKPLVEDLEHLRDEERRMSGLSKKFFETQNLLAQLEKERHRKREIESQLAQARAKMESLQSSVQALKEEEEKLERIMVGIQTLRAKKSGCESEVRMVREKIGELQRRKADIAELGKDAACPMCGRELGEDYPVILEHFDKESSEATEEIAEREDEIDKLKERLSKGEEMKRLTEQQVRSLRNERIQYEKTEELVRQLALQKTGLEKSVQEIEGRLRDLGDIHYEEENHQRLKQTIEEKGQVQERLAAYRTRLDSRSQLKKKREEGTRKIELLTEELRNTKNELESVNYSKETHRQSKSAHESLGERLEEERAALHSIEIDHKSTLNHLENLRLRSEEISRREGEARRLEDTAVTLTKLVELFGDFRLQLIQKIRPRLATLASLLFERMTEGKYRGIELSEDYELFLIEGANAYTIDRFSGGEADLANLALRLAISELITEATGNELSFIILDEIFGSQDTIRKGLIMSALKELSRRFRQILLITHVEEVKDSLEHIIEVYENADGVSVVQQG